MILKIADIQFSYDSENTLSDVGFEASEGDVVSILGPNGVGKTTLLKCINNIHTPVSGTVLVENDDILSMKRTEIAKKIGYVPQSSQVSGSTVFESVLIGRKPYITVDVTDKDIKLVSRVIETLGISSISDKKVNEVSGGEYQLVQIARAIVQQPKVLLLDEPTSNLDIKNQYEVLHKLAHIVRNNGMCAVMTNHDLNLALRFSNRFILMKDGKIFASGGSEVITPENIREVYGIEVSVGEVNGYKVIVPNEMHHMISKKASDFLSKRKKNPKQKEFFNDRADKWDGMSIHDMKKVEYIVDLLDIKDDSEILDVGTGTGVMINPYLSRMKAGHITAVDYSENMIEVARSKNPESDMLEYKVIDIYDMKENERYDRIVCYSCFPHFPDPVEAIHILSHALKMGGTLTIAHSSSKEHINNVHETGGVEICADYLPDVDVMSEFFHINGLEVIFSRDDGDYYIVIGKKNVHTAKHEHHHHD